MFYFRDQTPNIFLNNNTNKFHDSLNQSDIDSSNTSNTLNNSNNSNNFNTSNYAFETPKIFSNNYSLEFDLNKLDLFETLEDDEQLWKDIENEILYNADGTINEDHNIEQ